MGWGMWVLMVIGTAAFWAVVLMGIRALFLAGGNTPEQEFREASENEATPERSQPRSLSSSLCKRSSGVCSIYRWVLMRSG